MSPPDPITAAESPQALSALNRWLAAMSAQDRIAWAFDSLAGPHALSTSFGVQSAVSLHLLTQAKPDIPVILVDTGYLFPDTYRYADQLVQRFGIDLKVLPASPRSRIASASCRQATRLVPDEPP